ncbi:unnamed protein product [Phytophthora fragariaefolia]|uniref:Unnamed protein product n=1 Tax=Phytophthora fragariaefolia TaxID=1490495 RepID=A0A9W6TRK3_9STRA|nr:unnamed protein product [Phytophthora fragariaefolia]
MYRPGIEQHAVKPDRADGADTAMARTHNTAHIKQRMVGQALREVKVRAAASAGEASAVQRTREAEAAAAAASRAIVGQTHTRSETAAALQRLREGRVSAFGSGDNGMRCASASGSGDDGMHADEEDDDADEEQEVEEKKREEVYGEDEGVAAEESESESGESSPHQGQKRSVEEVDEDMLVTVPPF